MKVITREELGLRIRNEASLIVLVTAMIFVISGSLWAHFALHSSFFNKQFFILWLMLHAQPLLMLARKKLWIPLSLLGFLTLQVYLYFAFYRLEMPYVPLAPLFFVILGQCIPLFMSSRKELVWVYSVTTWLTVGFWMGQGAESQVANVQLPILIAACIQTVFQGSFALVLNFFRKRLSAHVSDFGRRESFDVQRIQASKLQTVGELTASLLHEINNPLTNINGYSYQIAEALKDKDPEIITITGEANDRIKFNVDRIKDITSAVRRLVRPSHQSQQQESSVRDLVNDAVALMKHQLKVLGIELKVDVESNDCQVRGNFTELSQVLMNLLGNARDALKDAELKVISLGFKADGDGVHLWVQDTGRGVPEEYAEDLFKPFFTTKADQEGTGLGLYISKLIADRNQAQLSFESVRDRQGRVLGTRFFLKLQHSSSASRYAA